MNYSKIKFIAETKKISIKDLCFEIGISEQGLHQMIRKNSMNVNNLEKLSKVLGVPISIFFDEEIPPSLLQEPVEKYQLKQKTECANCERLQKLIDSQSRHIERLEIDLEKCRERLKIKEAG